MTDHERSDRQLLAGLPEQPELIGETLVVDPADGALLADDEGSG